MPTDSQPAAELAPTIIAPIAAVLDGFAPLSLETLRQQIAAINARLDSLPLPPAIPSGL